MSPGLKRSLHLARFGLDRNRNATGPILDPAGLPDPGLYPEGMGSDVDK